MDEYIMFVDETLKTSKNPYFCMGGICVKGNYNDTVLRDSSATILEHFDLIYPSIVINSKRRI